MTFGVLGPLVVAVDSVPQALPRAAVVRGLLGALLLAEGDRLSAARLLELVWAGQADRVGRGAVHTGVSRLRGWLGQFGDDAVALESDGEGYRLGVGPDAVDLGRFRKLAAAGEPAAALGLRRGPVLAGLDRVNREDALVTSVEEAVRTTTLTLARTAPRSAVPAVTALADEYPFDEPVQAALLELLAADGRPAEALRRFQALRQRLSEELGIEPGEQVQRVFLALLARDHDTGPRTRTPSQLPPDLPDFTGREQPVQRVLDALADGRMPVIAGMGGIGKTALAVHTAHRAAADYPDGRLYADLRGADESPAEPARVLAAFLRALGADAREIPESLDERSALYRTLLADRRVLVVLDNAAGERQLGPLLPGTATHARSATHARPAVLVTSRTALTALPGARLVDLGELDPSHAEMLLRRIVGDRRVSAEPVAAGQIAELCGGMPLAVRIAGARLAARPRWSLARLADLLRDERRRLDELEAGDLAVRAGFAVGYARLPEPTRHTFRLLGLLDAPDFAPWVAAAVADLPVEEAERQLEELIDAQLLQETGAEPHLRYRFHDLVRLYAREHARTTDGPTVRAAALERAFGAWLRLAEQAADQVPGPCLAPIHGEAPRHPLPSGVAARLLDDPMAWFEAEQPALNASARQAAALRMVPVAWDLAACQEKYCDVRGLYDDWRTTHETVLRACRTAGDVRGEAVLTRGLIEVTTWTTPADGTQTMVSLHDRAQQLLGLFERVGEPRGAADALVLSAWSLVAQGRGREALDAGRRALDLATAHDHPGGEARAHQIIAVAYNETDIDRTIHHLTETLRLARLIGNTRFEATAIQFLGAAHGRAGHVERGRDLLTRSLAMARSLGDRYVEAFSLLYLAMLYAATGDDRARETAEAALAIARRFDMGHHLAQALGILGELDLAAGDHAAAVAHLEESVLVWRARGWRSFLAEALQALGRAYAAAGLPDSAERVRREARELGEGPANGGAGALTHGG
ncbi:BTAD domain-containing putative transcriptional regulator [Kitasatospora aureofaciens]|uniref:AfsR/SARP family transcriptional regulator n=1 Tax=Kitasatospora aureofaciens TaxID=1894 RepID=UPI00210E4181|nr:BTAD domain-containing putative transcriptional regulator [Kitasatospora aureofaciens]MBV6702736.1 tetratricopeptide repeat protein [Kitasatospora aureofaciens]